MTVLCSLRPSAFTKGFTAPAGKVRRCIVEENMRGFSRHLLRKRSKSSRKEVNTLACMAH